MKLANVEGRAALVLGDEIADVATASGGRFGPEPMALYDEWAEFAAFATTLTTGTGALVETELGNPVPDPARSSPSASTTAATPRSRAWRSPRCRSSSRSSPPA